MKKLKQEGWTGDVIHSPNGKITYVTLEEAKKKIEKAKAEGREEAMNEGEYIMKDKKIYCNKCKQELYSFSHIC